MAYRPSFSHYRFVKASSPIIVFTKRPIPSISVTSDKAKNNGVLLVIETDPDKVGDREVYIAVGQGLEGALPDGKIGRIIDEYTMPYLNQGSVDDAVLSTYQVLYNEVATEYGWDGELVEPKNPANTDEGFSFTTIIAIIIVIYVSELILEELS